MGLDIGVCCPASGLYVVQVMEARQGAAAGPGMHGDAHGDAHAAQQMLQYQTADPPTYGTHAAMEPSLVPGFADDKPARYAHSLHSRSFLSSYLCLVFVSHKQQSKKKGVSAPSVVQVSKHSTLPYGGWWSRSWASLGLVI